MSFPRYPKYKDSGVEWLGQVPEHWEAIRYKNVFQEKFVEAGGSLPLGSISFGSVVFKSEDFFNEATKATYQEVLAGEFLINPINLNYDLKSLRTALSKINTCVSPAYIVLKAKGAQDKNYLKHQLHAFDLFHMKTLGAGVRQTIAFGDIGPCLTYLPPLPEQSRIADFLDKETAKIDELVAEQERLMELLKEKRQAVISHAVTKGLNPKAALKPSSIEWLGDVPAHWYVGPVKRLIEKVESGTSVNSTDEPAEEGKLGVLKTSCVYSGKFEPWENKTVVAEDLTRVSCPLKAGTLIVSRMNTPELIGAAGLVTSAPANLFLPDRLWQISFTDTNASFVHYWTLTSLYRAQVSSVCTGTSSTMKNLGQDQFGCFPIATPPLKEQALIAAFLDKETVQFDTLTAEAQRAIDLLQERRTALISASVTGQIDVRNT